MECSLCSKRCSSNTPFHCATCARSVLYSARIDQVKLLLEREALRRQASVITSSELDRAPSTPTAGAAVVEAREGAKKYELERNLVAKAEAEERIEMISKQAKSLQEQINQYRQEVAARKEIVSRRRSELKTAQDGLAARRGSVLEALSERTEKVEHRWHRSHEKTVAARSFLVQEAADLAGLKLRRRKTKDGHIKQDYTIYGLGIVDLRDLNSASPSHITVSLTHIARLLMLCSRYLQLRLPAEITLPHPDYHLPTIFTPTSSYLGKQVPFPGTTPSYSSNTTPEASRAFDQRPLRRPRPLFLDRKLTRLAKEDPAAYAFFIEGVCLLAWDIAWLCRTQGMSTGLNSWEDICPLGKNLYQLLVARPAQTDRLPLEKTASTKDVPSAAGPTPASNSTSGPPGEPPLGHLSHGTSHSFLGSAEGTEYMRAWKLLGSPMKLVDKVKAALQAEMSGAEWEVVDGKEWDDDGENGGLKDEPVFVGGTASGKRESGSADGEAGGRLEERKVVSSATVEAAESETADRDSAGEGRPKGTSGWTKVKSRGP